MFRIICFCDDKKLAPVLRALQGFGVFNLTSVPVNNAAPAANGELKLRLSAEDRGKELLKFAAKHKMQTMTPADVKAFVEEIGFTRGYYSKILQNAIEEGVLVKTNKKSIYRVKR